MNNSTVNPQIEIVLKQIEKFGFKFFSYGENNEPLVIAPNGQIIPLKIAYEFVQEQIKKSQEQQSSKGIESMPSIPQMPDIGAIEVNIEKAEENETSSIDFKTSDGQTRLSASQSGSGKDDDVSKLISKEIKMPAPFEEGFKIKSFDPTILDQATNFISANKGTPNTTSKAWLATLFKKFIDEYNSKNT